MALTDFPIREPNSPFSMLCYFYVLPCCVLFAHGAVDTTDLTVMEGDHTEMRCVYEGEAMSWRYYSDMSDSVGDIVSYNQNVYPPYDERFSPFHSSAVYGLSVQNANLTDHGIYKCTYSSSLVSITVMRIVPLGSPTCEITPSYQDELHRDITLACDSGLTNNFPQIRWFRRNIELKNTTGATLDIDTALTSEGEDVAYTCVIGDGDRRSLPSCSIIPFPSKPTGEITPPTEAVAFGNNATFKCTGSANSGSFNVTWGRSVLQRFDGRYALSSGDTQLELFDIRPSDNNTNVTCIVTASSGTQTTVTAVLQLTKDPESIGTQSLDRKGDIHDAGDTSIMFFATVTAAMTVLVVAAAMCVILLKKRSNRQTPVGDHGTATKMNAYADTHAYDDPPRSGDNGQVTQYSNVVHIAGSNVRGGQSNGVSLGHGTLQPVSYAPVGKSGSILNDPNESICYEELRTSSETLAIRAKRSSGYDPDDNADYAEVEKASDSSKPTVNGTVREDVEMYAVVDEKGGKTPKEGNADSESTNTKWNYERVNSFEENVGGAMSDDVYAEPEMTLPWSVKEYRTPVSGGEVDQAAPSKPVPKYAKVNKPTTSLDLQEYRHVKPFGDKLGLIYSGGTTDGNATVTNNDDLPNNAGKPKYAKVNKSRKSKSVDHQGYTYALPDLNLEEGSVAAGGESVKEKKMR